MRILLDSYAWMELFKGTEKGAKVRRLIENEQNEAYTSAANYYEVYYSVEAQYGTETRAEHIAALKASSKIIQVDEAIAEAAARIRLETGLHALDAFTLAAARTVGAKVVTGDPHLTKFSGEVIQL